LPNLQPMATDYARALDRLLDELNVNEALVLGHSLGAIVAAAWCATTKRNVRGLLLASPARGYATASDAVRETKYRERLQMLERLGIAGMAAERSTALCAPQASAQAVTTVRDNMALITPGGYAQAAWMLANDDLMGHLRKSTPPLAVLCGELDRTTPPEACERIARDGGAPFVLLPGVAHACYIEDAAQFNRALSGALHQGPLHG
jgi:pimeloyl-ACP methyl ester carboxylesterase